MSLFDEYLITHPDKEEELIERAAIMEYDGGLDRQLAERMAVDRLKRKDILKGERQ